MTNTILCVCVGLMRSDIYAFHYIYGFLFPAAEETHKRDFHVLMPDRVVVDFNPPSHDFYEVK